MRTISYGRQFIDNSDIKAVADVLRSSHLTQGPAVEAFERAIADYCGSRYAIAVSSGTAALHLACLAAGFKKGDVGITSPITFLATSNAVIYAGGRPQFVDVKSDMSIDPQQIEKTITKKTKAILPVHFAGIPCDMAGIQGIAKKHKLVVIEDACHALGAKYKIDGKWWKIGSCRHSDMAVFSFHPVKHITTGEGGAITTNDSVYYARLKQLRSHGMYKDAVMLRQKPWYYEMRELGFNYRITDIQCALGLSQLKKIARFIKRRREIKERYDAAFEGIDGLGTLKESSQEFATYHLNVLLIDFKKFKTDRTRVMQALKQKGIYTQVHYIPIYRQPYYKKHFPVSAKKFPMAERYYERCLSIPLYPAMTDADVATVIKGIKSLL